MDSRFRGNDGSTGFPLPRLRGHRFRGNDDWVEVSVIPAPAKNTLWGLEFYDYRAEKKKIRIFMAKDWFVFINYLKARFQGKIPADWSGDWRIGIQPVVRLIFPIQE